MLRSSSLILVFVCLLIVGDTAAQRRALFDFNWKFALNNQPGAEQLAFNDVNWRTVHLPHDWSIEGKVHPNNTTSGGGGYFPAGTGWYRKLFKAPESWKGKSISIYFEGVYMNAEVFINGKSLGVYPYGYSSFAYNLTPYLYFGKENIIAVKVDNAQQPNSRWYSGSGIYRHVWMQVTEPLYIANWGVAIQTEVVSEKKAITQVKTIVKNETGSKQQLILKAILQDENGEHTAARQTTIDLDANSEKEVIQSLVVANPLLWTPGAPHLYKAQVQVMQGKKIIDYSETAFGIRTIKFSAENGFQLNGKTVKLNGGCVHHDNGCLGAAAFNRAEERKVELLKAAGFNAVRTAHNPPSEAFLDACDRLGLLVIDEAFDCWKIGKTKHDYAQYFNAWWKQDLEAMIKRDRNHPSIIMWSIGNEIVERGSRDAVETAAMLRNAIKQMDTTRPITSAVVNTGKDWYLLDTLFAQHDVAGYNYQLHSAPADHQRVPGRMVVHTESYPRDAFANWKLVQNNSYIIGDFVWTAIDYLGEAGIGRNYYSGETSGEHWENDFFPWHGAYCGDMDLTGWRKPIAHYRSMLYNNKEKLYLAVKEPNPEPLQIKTTWWSVWPTWESWNWTGFEGRDIEVEVYSKYPAVRLYLNDKLIGEKLTSIDQEYKAVFAVPYLPGTLKAVAVENNREVASAILKTAGDAANIQLTADRKTITADGQDLLYVNIEITDKAGVVQPNADSRLHIEIDGPGTIMGIDNANLKDTDPYTGNTRKAWHGRALAIIRSTQDAGNINLKVSAPGLAEALLQVQAIPGKMN